MVSSLGGENVAQGRFKTTTNLNGFASSVSSVSQAAPSVMINQSQSAEEMKRIQKQIEDRDREIKEIR